MRHGDTAANPGAAEPLAFGEYLVNLPLAAARNHRGAPGNFLQGLFLPVTRNCGITVRGVSRSAISIVPNLGPSLQRPRRIVPGMPRTARETRQDAYRFARPAFLDALRPASSAGSIQPILPSLRR